jgi:hypothetical protein
VTLYVRSLGKFPVIAPLFECQGNAKGEGSSAEVDRTTLSVVVM